MEVRRCRMAEFSGYKYRGLIANQSIGVEMPKFVIKRNVNDNGLSSEAGERGIRLNGPSVNIQVDEQGKYGARPTSAYASISRKVDTTDNYQGKLTLLTAAVESQQWENRNEQDDNWPVIEFTFDRDAVPDPIDVQQITMTRILVDGWSLTWKANDDAGNGTDFRESLNFRASKINKTALYGGAPVAEADLD